MIDLVILDAVVRRHRLMLHMARYYGVESDDFRRDLVVFRPLIVAEYRKLKEREHGFPIFT